MYTSLQFHTPNHKTSYSSHFFSDITKLIVTVTDVNDNKPRFSTTSYQASIRANAKPAEQVVHLVASDLDSDLNGLIYYNITEGNGNSGGVGDGNWVSMVQEIPKGMVGKTKN